MSGSTTLETVRNNLFVVACENFKLYDNFGSYFQQAKYFEQNYDEDQYVSGSGTYVVTTPDSEASVSGSFIQWATIPAYRKQLDFMVEASINGSTLYGIIRATNAFTLVNPDIRELYSLPQWKLKTFSGQVMQLSTSVWRFAGESWKPALWAGAHATFVSGSAPTDKVTAGYVVIINDNNTVTVGPIYDNNLFFDFRGV
jgi:hypothetical protein